MQHPSSRSTPSSWRYFSYAIPDEFFYVAVALLKRKKFTCRNENHRIAVLIAARNEENVIGQLLDSIHAQKNYPMDHVDIFVVRGQLHAMTRPAWRASAARSSLSATIRSHVGKGYALNEMLQRIERHGPQATTMPISCWTPTISSTRTSSPRSRRSTPAAMRS